MNPENAIEVRNVSKAFKVYLDKGHTMKEMALFSRRRRYEKAAVLNDISFDVKKGESVALIGHNGCGKSTTLKLLTRIMYPDSGTIEIKGRVSSLIELGAGFHPDMSGRENIYINASIFGLTKKEIDSRLDDIIEFSELREFIDNPVRTYSSGMYMRLAFAVAINVNADVLLVDEILAVGDANFQAKCYEKMSELKASGITIVLVTHDSGTVKRFCDKAIWINDGKIVSQGESNEVVDEYLSWMDAERLNSLLKKNNEKRNSGFKTDSKQKAFDIKPLTMDRSAKHYGNQNAIITQCKILNEKGDDTTVLRSNEHFYIQIDYEMYNPLDEIVVGFGIFDLNGVWIFGTNSKILGFPIRVKAETGTVVLDISPLNLLSGKYVLQCSIEELDTTPCDYYQDYCHFNVVSSFHEAGLIHYDVKWKHLTGGKNNQ